MSNVFQTVKKAVSADNKDTTILISIAIGILCLVICGILGWKISHKAAKYITLIIELAGMACGAFLGFLASPKAPGEQATFLTFAKAISLCISGLW
jgi:arginine exporter protein ArgO